LVVVWDEAEVEWISVDVERMLKRLSDCRKIVEM
jgi:hypothetical protein